MKKIDIVFIFSSLIIACVCFLVTLSPIYPIAIFGLYIAYYFFILRKKFRNYYSLIDRVHSCYHFINSFIITLSVKESYEDAFQSGIRITNKELNSQINELNNLDVYDKVKYLRNYFNLSIYKMFLNILDLYQDQGGSILSMSDNLIRECTRTEKILSETLSIGYKHIIEFIFLWLLSFGILVFMRFGISDFYQRMMKGPFFLPMLILYFVICLVSIHLFFVAFTNLTVKEDSGS